MRINKAILKNIGKAAAKESARYALQSIKFEQTADECRAVATDAKILTYVEWRSPENGLADGSLIRANAATLLSRLRPILRELAGFCETCESQIDGLMADPFGRGRD